MTWPQTAADLEQRLRSLVRDVPDFPHDGILFKDITTLLRDPQAFHDAIEALAAAHREDGIDVVVGVESRGFVLGGAVAYLLGAGFVPVRKQGKLPAETVAVEYALEYGQATLEIHRDALSPGDRVLIVDDLLATGGTAAATVSLIEQLHGEVVAIAFLIELEALGGARVLGERRRASLISF